jgi:hypothetical protein
MKKMLTTVAIAGSGVALLAGVTFASVGNDHTGYNSDNNASLKVENEASITNSNHYNVDNDIFGKANTGDNKAEKNTGDGSVDTGSTDFNVSVTNKGNSATTNLSGFGDMGTGSMSVTNSTTGADSNNNAWVKLENELKVYNHNYANVDNNIKLYSNTGDNKASFNTGDGSVSTGDSSATITLENNLNTINTTLGQ